MSLIPFLPEPVLIGTAALAFHALELWLRGHAGLVLGLGVVSVLLCVGSVVMTPVLVARLPEDYLTRLTATPVVDAGGGPSWRKRVLRNVLGVLLLVVGLLLVPLPGPGSLVLLLALGLVDFPAKRRLLAWILRWPAVLDSLNWLRRRHHRPDLLPPAVGR